MPTAAVLWAASVMVLTGVVLGLLITVYGSLRAEWRFPRWLSPVVDIVFVLTATLPVAAGLLLASWGTVRLWAVTGLLLGLLGWSALGAPLVAAAARWVARQLRRLGRWAARTGGSRLCPWLRWRLPKRAARN